MAFDAAQRIMLLVTTLVGYAQQAASGAPQFGALVQGVVSGGGKSVSASYQLEASLTPMDAVRSTTDVPNYTILNGFWGQIYEVASLTVGASALDGNVNENSTFSLSVGAELDDGTALSPDPSTIAWNWSPPIAAVGPDGTARTETVYRDTPAQISACFGSKNSSLNLIVLNVDSDDFGLYANDGIDDAWQVGYFGLGADGNGDPKGAAYADPSGTGQTNLLKYLAGLDPLSSSSVFQVGISRSGDASGPWEISFGPIAIGRTYTVEFTHSLSEPAWQSLAGSLEADAGSTRTVTDPKSDALATFYRVRIQWK